MMGIGNTLATIPGVIGPVMSASILERDGNWAALLRSAAAVLCVSAAVFAVCSSMPAAEQQLIMPEGEDSDEEEEAEARILDTAVEPCSPAGLAAGHVRRKAQEKSWELID